MRLNGFSKWIKKVEGYKEPLFEYDESYTDLRLMGITDERLLLGVLLNEIRFDMIVDIFTWERTPDRTRYWSDLHSAYGHRYLYQIPNNEEIREKLLGMVVGVYGEEEAFRLVENSSI